MRTLSSCLLCCFGGKLRGFGNFREATFNNNNNNNNNNDEKKNYISWKQFSIILIIVKLVALSLEEIDDCLMKTAAFI